MATRDCTHIPLWKESVDLAHAVLASLEESGARTTGPGRDACRAAVAVPSLVEEALFHDRREDQPAALSRAREKLGALRTTLAAPDLASRLDVDQKAFLLDGISRLDRDLAKVDS